MVAIKGVAHFSIPVSDVARSARFYTEVVGCRLLSTTPNGQMVFLDAAGTCLILVKRDAPINPVHDNHGGVHHAFAVAHDAIPFSSGPVLNLAAYSTRATTTRLNPFFFRASAEHCVRGYRTCNITSQSLFLQGQC